MKRMLSICLAITILLVAVPIAPSMALSEYGTVTGGWLRLRSGPSFDSSTISSYYTGTQVKILSSTGSWYEVQAPDGKTGYMYASYITFSGGGGGTAYVTSSNGLGVRMRTGPGTGYAVIGVYSVGTSLTVLQSGSTWSKIQIGTRVGYMMNKFITTNGGGGGGGDVATIWSANGYGVRLRSGPGTGYSILGVYSVGTLVTVHSKGTTWDRVSVGSRTGYMMNMFLVYNNSKTVSAVTLNNTTPVVGSELYAASITPSGATVSYAWYAGSTLVGEASTYSVTYDDLGKQMKLHVTGIGSYSGSATSALTSAVATGIDLVSGELNNPSPVIGDVLNVINLLPTGAKATYQWFVGGTLAGTKSSYTVTSADLNKSVSVDVTGTGLYTGTFTIIADNTVQSAGTVNDVTITNSTNPTEIGKEHPNVGDVLVATPVPATATVSYKWTYVNGSGTTVTLGTASKLTVPTTADLVGRAITVTVTGTGRYIGGVSPSASTDEVVSLKNLTEVRLNPYAPRLDEESATPATIVATVYAKDTADPVTANCDIVWYRGDVLTATTGDTYDLTADDCGYLITAVATADGATFAGTKSRTTTSRVLRKLYSVAIADADGTPVTEVSVGDVLTAVLNDGTDIQPNNTYMTLNWQFNGVTTKTLEYTVPATNSLSGGLKLSVTTPAGSIYYISGSLTSPTVTVNKAIITLPDEGTLEAPVAGLTYTLAVTPETAKATYVWKKQDATTIKTTSIPSLLIPSSEIGKTISVTVTPSAGYQFADSAPTKTLTLPAVAAQLFEAYIQGTTTLNATMTIVTDPANATVTNTDWYDASNNHIGLLPGRTLKITDPALVGQTLKALVHGGGNFKTDVWTSDPPTPETLEALMMAYDPLLEAEQAEGTTEETVTPDDTGTDAPPATDDTATEEPPATDDTATEEPPGTADDGQTAPEQTEEQPAAEPEPVAYTAEFINLPSDITAGTDLTVLTNAEGSVAGYAWYRGNTHLEDVTGYVYRVTQSDIDAEATITVYVTFDDGGQASTYVRLRLPADSETLVWETEQSDGTEESGDAQTGL
jgi:uncharacterized protein YgiM (DUF1202 family)